MMDKALIDLTVEIKIVNSRDQELPYMTERQCMQYAAALLAAGWTK
jgi:hypothetical protein